MKSIKSIVGLIFQTGYEKAVLISISGEMNHKFFTGCHPDSSIPMNSVCLYHLKPLSENSISVHNYSLKLYNIQQ